MLWVQKNQTGSRGRWKILCKKMSVIFTKSRIPGGCGTRVTYTHHDFIIPTRGVQLEESSPRSICNQGFIFLFSSSFNYKQELCLLQDRAVGSLQQHLHWERRGDALGWASSSMGKRGGVGGQGEQDWAQQSTSRALQGAGTPPLPFQCRGSQACRICLCFQR